MLSIDVDLQPMTDQAIYQMALEEWMGVLDQLWVAVGKPVDSVRLDVYRNNLGRVPLGLLENAVGRLLREHIYNTVPTLGEIWSAIRKELGNPYDLDQAMEHWSQVSWESAIHRFSVAVETDEP
jgi:hypothetical protein